MVGLKDNSDSQNPNTDVDRLVQFVQAMTERGSDGGLVIAFLSGNLENAALKSGYTATYAAVSAFWNEAMRLFKEGRPTEEPLSIAADLIKSLPPRQGSGST